jgi:signal transduction histidine kinase/DNA-binding response OmpR family regulator
MEELSKSAINGKILIVDDDEGLNTLLQRIIKRAGYAVDGAYSGQEALEKIRSQSYYLLLLDYMLSDMSAAQLVELFPENGIQIPFVVMTGQGDETIAVRMMKLGAKDYLIKEGNYLDIIPHTIKRLTSELEIERKYLESQEKLRESQEKLRIEHEQLLSVYESITEPIYVSDLETYEILFTNSAFKEHFGEINDTCYKQVYNLDAPCDSCPIPFLTGNRKETYYWEQHNTRNDHWYRCVDKIIQWKSNKDAHFQLAIDITTIKESEQQLIKSKEKAEEADRLKSAFLANMSHEIRTPMNAILGFTDILIKQEFDHERQIEFLQIIQQRSNDLLQIINDILDSSRIEVGQMDIFESNGDLSELFDEIYQFYMTREFFIDNKKAIDLRKKLSLKPKQQQVVMDFTRIKQILCNFIDNAFKFTISGYIEFGCSLTNENELLLFYVKDTGIGIPKDKHGIIFDRFRQADETFLTKKTGGTGLGLSISKSLVELMNGKIWVESSLNNGSCFFFSLPYKPISSAAPYQQAVETEFLWKDRTILIVEDDPFNSALFMEYIADTQVRCLLAKNGAETMETFHREPQIDLILMDIRLPDSNGLELTRQIKAIKPNIIIIAQTAYAYDNDKESSIHSGCNDYITKPISKVALLKLMNKYLEVAVPVSK